ncbi:MAG: hypothetical protein QM766_27555 [Burkholderiaceae bacterium]
MSSATRSRPTRIEKASQRFLRFHGGKINGLKVQPVVLGDLEAANATPSAFRTRVEPRRSGSQGPNPFPDPPVAPPFRAQERHWRRAGTITLGRERDFALKPPFDARCQTQAMSHDD